MIDFDVRVADFEKTIGGKVKQNLDEARELYRLVERIKPRVFIEIGSEWGGTLYTYAGACHPGATVIAVDKGDRFPARKFLKATIRELNAEGFDAWWVRGNSHEAETLRQVIFVLSRGTVLDGRRADFLHIDGDHSEAGAQADWDNFSPLVRKGGIVAFHDIIPERRGCYVSRAWRRIKQGRNVTEIIKGPTAWNKDKILGIGVVTI